MGAVVWANFVAGVLEEKEMKTKRRKPYAANNASKKYLESQGWTVTVVEQTLGGCFIKRDAFGFGDLLAMSPSRGIMLVQATGGGHLPDRLAKVKAEARHAIWLACGGRIQVHDWRKVAGQSQRQLHIYNVRQPDAV